MKLRELYELAECGSTLTLIGCAGEIVKTGDFNRDAAWVSEDLANSPFWRIERIGGDAREVHTMEVHASDVNVVRFMEAGIREHLRAKIKQELQKHADQIVNSAVEDVLQGLMMKAKMLHLTETNTVQIHFHLDGLKRKIDFPEDRP